jgi:hypothetical protein
MIALNQLRAKNGCFFQRCWLKEMLKMDRGKRDNDPILNMAEWALLAKMIGLFTIT